MISTLPFSYSARVLSRKISFGGGWGVGWERADFAKTQYENALLSFGGSINLASRENRSVHWKKIIHKLFFFWGGGGGGLERLGGKLPPLLDRTLAAHGLVHHRDIRKKNSVRNKQCHTHRVRKLSCVLHYEGKGSANLKTLLHLTPRGYICSCQ